MRVCAKCGSSENLHEHHIIPKSIGGTDADGRILLCKKHHDILHLAIPKFMWKFVQEKEREDFKKYLYKLTKEVFAK